MKRALGYIRVSKDPKREKLSPEVQRERIKDYCKLKEWQLLDIYCTRSGAIPGPFLWFPYPPYFLIPH